MDFDNDGDNDILSGSWPGELYFFEQTEDGTYADGTKIKDRSGKEIKAGSASTVFASDWDSDGDLDLLVGDIRGNVYLITNEGTRDEPQFGQPDSFAKVSAEIRGRSGDSGPVVADWDSDGKHDLLVGCGDGSVLWFRNVGTNEKPLLTDGEELVEKSPFGFDFAKRQPGQWGARVKVHVVDWNGDGKQDLLVGDRSGSVEKLSDEDQAEVDLNKRLLADVRVRRNELRESQRDLRKAISDGDETAETQQKFKDLSEAYREATAEYSRLSAEASRSASTKQVRHGFIWLFARK